MEVESISMQKKSSKKLCARDFLVKTNIIIGKDKEIINIDLFKH